MSRTRVKLCGMRDPDQVSAAINLGVDAIGLIFYANSPRCVTEQVAMQVRAVVPAFVQLVGVFVNEDVVTVNHIAKNVGLDLVQLHGDEDAGYAKRLQVPYLRAVRVRNAKYVSQQIAMHTFARGVLLDTYSPQNHGGTGARFDSDLLPDALPRRTIIAGGIDADNVAAVLEKFGPYAIDVNSGVELSPANKNLDALTVLLEKVRRHDLAVTL